MAKPMDGDTWEIGKLGSDPNISHKGAGRLFIISNSKLVPALHIYEKYGFKEIKLDDYEYERGDIAFEKILKAER